MSLKRHIVFLVVLGSIWCLLSGHYSSLLLGLGLVSCVISYQVFCRVTRQFDYKDLSISPLGQIRFTVWLLLEIVKSNIDVIRAILDSTRVYPEVFSVKTSDLDELGRVIYANSITLTPGTVSMDVSQDEIQVHGLPVGSKEGLTSNKMLSRVRLLNRIR